jgi:hypothetical protein
MLQLENPIQMIERLRDSRGIDGLDAGQHYLNYDGSPAGRQSAGFSARRPPL